MRYIEENKGLRVARAWLTAFDTEWEKLGRWLGRLSMAVLLLTGEAIPFIDYDATPFSLPLLRSLHVLSGLILLLVVSGRLGGAIMRGLKHIAQRRGVHPEDLAFMVQEMKSPQRLIAAGYWTVAGLFLLSGMERYFHLRYGASLLPGLSPLKWALLHLELRPYLYGILLFLFIVQGKLVLKTTVKKLRAP